MSLVAYTFSGSEGENSEDDDVQHDLIKESNLPSTNIVSSDSSNLHIQLSGEILNKSAQSDMKNKSFNVSPKNRTDLNITESIDDFNFPTNEVEPNLCLKSNSFSTLPPPKTKTNPFFEEGDLEEEVVKNKSFLNLPPVKKKDGRVKIALPALPDLDSDEEEPTKKKVKSISGSSSLFAFLPEPVNMTTKEKNRPLIPHTLSKKTSAPKVPPNIKAIDPSPGIQSLTAYDSADVEDDEEETSSADFFSLSSSPKKPMLPSNPIIINPISINLEDTSKWATPNSDIMDAPLQFNKKSADNFFEVQTPYNYSNAYNQEYNFTDDSLIDSYSDSNQVHSDSEFQSNIVDYTQDKEFIKMQGKKHCGKEEITIIDVNADDQLCDSQSFLTKSLSEEKEYRSSRKKGGMPTMQQRRKHQITYLAFQAKERELELKNQWSQNRLTKKQTQAKYGF